MAALARGAAGVYNVVDDEPAPLHEWLPVYAETLGAKPPRRVPVWLAKLVAGSSVAEMAVGMRGASNTKAKRELGWQPSTLKLARWLPRRGRHSGSAPVLMETARQSGPRAKGEPPPNG